MSTPKSIRQRDGGVILVTALVTLGVTAVVGIAAGLVIVGQSAGCADVLQRVDANEPVTEEELERCASAFQRQITVAGAAASFVPTGADDAIVTAPLSTLIDRASQPAPGADVPLPAEVVEALACGNGKKDPGEQCDASAPKIGCGARTCISCSCVTVPSLPACPDKMPSHLGDWELDPGRGASHVPGNGYANTTLSAVCYYRPPAAAGLPADGHLRFFVDAVHAGLSETYRAAFSCASDTFRKGLEPLRPGLRIVDTGEPDWFPVSSTSDTLVSPDRCAAAKVIYYPTGGGGSASVQWLRAHPRVLFEAHALAEQLFLQAERSAFKRP